MSKSRVYDVDFKLRFIVSGPDDFAVSPAELEAAIGDVMSDWNDGRFPLFVEMMHHAAKEISLRALCNLVEGRMQSAYRNEVVDMPSGGRSSRAAVEAEKIWSRLAVLMHPSRLEEVSVRAVADAPADEDE